MQHDTAALQDLDRQHFIHPFTDSRQLADKGTRIIQRADGVYLWDSEGRQLLDGMSGLWCVNVGYGRERLAKAAYRQLQELPYYNSFFQCTTAPAIELAARLAELAPAHINHVFFTGSGSESNDTVVRMVRRYWALLEQPQKSVIISRRNAYHGSTVAGASLGGMAAMHAQGGLPIPDIVHIDQPYYFGEGGVGEGSDEDPAAFGLRIARQLEQKILELGVDRVAAFIGEPIQGAGGVIIPPETYWPEIQRICQQYGILLVADEVICGFGRLGEWFGCDHFGIHADLMPIAKGMTSGYLPMGGLLISDRVAEVVIQRCGEFTHGYTYSAHPAACAVALENLAILEEEQLVERVANDIGPYLQQRWRELAAHPLVGEVRGVGLIGALELVPADAKFFPKKGLVGTACRDICVESGLVMRAVGDTMIIAPPLIISHAQVDELIAKASLALDKTQVALAGMDFAR